MKIFLTINTDLQILVFLYHILQIQINHIDGVIVIVVASSAVDRGFEPRSGQRL